ncbi:hypothetical protein HGB25_02535 [Candidatus Saccharibacteria bacterium]|nr:hypothetical protein [Candidatus Saccharibacteria bacterium]
MNPETKATAQQIKTICEKHGIEYRNHSRITVGFNHELHRINDDLVIKIYNVYGLDDGKRFRLESALLGSDVEFLKPQLIVSDDSRDIIDRDFIIMSYVPGKSLGSVWHLASDNQRENLIKTICESLKLINTLTMDAFSIDVKQSWQDMIGDRLEAHVVRLLGKNVIDEQKASQIRDYFDKNKEVLANSRLYPVFWDVHFDNFIVDGDFDLMAMIDLESVRMASLDYPLFVINKMMNVPKAYLSEEYEKFADQADYVNLKKWYQRYYPEMFEVADLDARVQIYMLLDTLHMLEDWPHIMSLFDELDERIS